MEIEKIRQNIILKEGIKYFDWTAGGLGFYEIEDEILRIMKTYSNTHSLVSSNSIKTTDYYENAVKKMKEILGVNKDFSLIACGFGATWAIKRFEEILGLYIPPATRARLDLRNFKNLPLVIISPFEHHSVEVSLRLGLCEVVRIPLNKNGLFDFDFFEKVLENARGREIIGIFNVASNISGIINDYQKIYLMIKMYGGIVALDGSTYITHGKIDANFYDALFISTHKFLGGIGAPGILIIKNSLFKSDLPTFAGGGNVNYVSRTSQDFKAQKEELETPGTPAILGVIKAYLALKLWHDVGENFIQKTENELAEHFLNEVSKIKELKIYGNSNVKRAPIFSFNVNGFNPYDFASILSHNFEIQTRAGCMCAGPYARDLLGLTDDEKISRPGFVRVSFNFTQELADIDFLIAAIKEIIKNKEKFNPNYLVKSCCG